MKGSKLSIRDQICNWHPYTQHKTASPPIGIVKGKGALLWDEEGKEYIDAIASWWCNSHGHANKYIADRIYKQLLELEHVLFGGFTHSPAVELSEKILKLLPGEQTKIFYSDNGSTAVEVALKMALQFFYNKKEKRDTIVAFQGAFHGDTFGAMAPSGISFFTKAFEKYFIKVKRISLPSHGNEQKSLQELEAILKEGKTAAFIFEPLIQGAAGMLMYEEKSLDELIKICKKYHVLTIADEVMTGFFRTGKLFACDYLGQKPDIFCLSKALTAGFIPMAITSSKEAVFQAFYDEDVNKALFHGHTFMANPAGCAAGLASLELTLSQETLENTQRIHQSHKVFSRVLASYPEVKNIRLKGVILAWDLQTKEKQSYYGTLRNKLYDFFIENGVILRPIGSSVYIFPPFCIETTQLQKVYQVVLDSLKYLRS